MITCQALTAEGQGATLGAESETLAVQKGAPLRKAASAADKDSIRFSGQVLGSDGKPFVGAKVYLLSDGKVRATTDKDGRFRFTASREEASSAEARLRAVADGCGPAWVSDLREPEGLTLCLVKDDVSINGRIVDLQGKAVAGVTLKVNALKAPAKGNLDAWLEAAKMRKDGEGLEREYLALLPAQTLVKLFPPIATDHEGRFRLKGIGRERMAALIVEGPSVETQEINVVTRPKLPTITLSVYPQFPPAGELRYYASSFDLVIPPGRPVVGVVRDRTTRKPLAGVVVRSESTVGNPPYHVQTTTDVEGRYRLTGLGKAREGQPVTVRALPPNGQPYLAMKKPVKGPGLGPLTLDFELTRGVWLQGQVKDKATGRGVESLLTYCVFSDAQTLFISVLPAGNAGRTDKEGKFRIVAYPGRGLLGVNADGPGRSHYRIGVGAEEIKGSEENPFAPGTRAFLSAYPLNALAMTTHADAWKEVNPVAGAEAVTCDVVLDPGSLAPGSRAGARRQAAGRRPRPWPVRPVRRVRGAPGVRVHGIWP